MTNTEFYPLWQTKTRETEVAIAPLSDHALARAAGEGDMTAFEELYSRHNRRVYSVCLRMTHNVSEAEDLTQKLSSSCSAR